MIRQGCFYGVLTLILLGSVTAQTNDFEFIQHDTAYTGSEALVVQYGEIINLTDTPLDLTVSRVTHAIPASWSCSFCVGSACLPPFLDEHSFTLEASDTSEFSLDTTPNGEAGVGSWTMFTTNLATSEVDSVHITLEYVAVAIDGDQTSQLPSQYEIVRSFPNPTNAAIALDLRIPETGIYALDLFSLGGQMVLQRDYQLLAGENRVRLNLVTIPSGVYILEIHGNGIQMSKKLSIVK